MPSTITYTSQRAFSFPVTRHLPDYSTHTSLHFACLHLCMGQSDLCVTRTSTARCQSSLMRGGCPKFGHLGDQNIGSHSRPSSSRSHQGLLRGNTRAKPTSQCPLVSICTPWSAEDVPNDSRLLFACVPLLPGRRWLS